MFSSTFNVCRNQELIILIKYEIQNYTPPTDFPSDSINALLNNNNQPNFRSYGNPQGADFWQIWGKAGLIKRTPNVTRQERRLARMNSYYGVSIHIIKVA